MEQEINKFTSADEGLRIWRDEKAQANADAEETRRMEKTAMYACHCGKSFHARLCHYRCPFCYCGTYTEAAKCNKLKMEARIAAENARIPTLTEKQIIAQRVSQGIIVEGCKGCEPFFKNPNAFAPSHNASKLCQSGKRSHCTCDGCF